MGTVSIILRILSHFSSISFAVIPKAQSFEFSAIIASLNFSPNISLTDLELKQAEKDFFGGFADEDECLERTENGFIVKRNGREPITYVGDIKDIKIVRKMITINDNTTSKRKVGYGIDWLKVNEEGEINSVNLYTDSSFEGIIKMIQIEYRLDNSPKI